MPSTNTPLKVLVIGAGISGLTAALGLRRQGHQVTVYERSALLKEYGAAISIGPNANAVLRRLGVFLEKDAGAVDCNGFLLFQGETLKHVQDQRSRMAKFKHPYHFVLRQDLHRALIDTAKAKDGQGPPVTIITASKVVDVNPSAGAITLENGESVQGDLVIGGDGVHSRSRNKIPAAEDMREHPYGKSAFRCLIPMQELLDDPKTRPFAEKTGHFVMWTHKDLPQVAVMYPGANSTKMNFATTHDDALVDGSDTTDLKEKLHKCFGVHSSMLDALCTKIEPSTLGMWKYNDMDQMPSFINGKFAVIGDAAHPFLPFLGQGGAMAIEDAASIAALLPIGTQPGDVTGRLKLYQHARYDRAHFVQSKTRDQAVGGMARNNPHTSKKTDDGGAQMADYLFGHDAWEESEKLLHESNA